MIKKTPARTPAQLSIVGVVIVSMLLAACGANQAPATATISAPSSNAQYIGGDEVKIEGKVTGSNVKLVDIYINGSKFATIDKPARPNEFDVTVVWTAPGDIAGSSVIQLKGVDQSGAAVVSSEAVFVNVQAPPTPTPEPTVEPTAVPTAVPQVQPTAAPQIQPTAPPVLLAPKADGDFVNVRAQPDINSARLGQINKGQSAPVLGKNADGKWFQISFPTSTVTVGWVLGEVAQLTGDTNALPVIGATGTTTSTTPTTSTTTTTGTVAATAAPVTAGTAPFVKLKAGQDFANVRTGPDTAYDRVGQLDATKSTASAKGKNADGTWFQIEFQGAPGNLAWVFGQLVDLTGDVTKLPVGTAPPLPTAAPATAAPIVTVAAPTAAVTAPTAIPAQPPSALLPYSQNMRFAPRDDIGDVPLGYQGAAKSATLQWQINGATKAELEIQTTAGPGIFSACPVGNLGSISPNDAAGKRIPLQLPSGEYNFSISAQGYYIFTIYVVKADGSTTSIPRNVIVDCYKSQ